MIVSGKRGLLEETIKYQNRAKQNLLTKKQSTTRQRSTLLVPDSTDISTAFHVKDVFLELQRLGLRNLIIANDHRLVDPSLFAPLAALERCARYSARSRRASRQKSHLTEFS